MASRAFQEWYDKFADTGDIYGVRLGMSRDELRAVLGDPDYVGPSPSRKRRDPTIWVYEGLEFHFDYTAEYKLVLIYRDTAEGIVEICIKRHPANRRGETPGVG